MLLDDGTTMPAPAADDGTPKMPADDMGGNMDTEKKDEPAIPSEETAA